MRVSPLAVFKDAGYTPHPGQVPVHVARQNRRFRWVSAGRRYGKSNLGGNELLVAAQEAYAVQNELEPKGRRHEYWIVGPEYTDSEKEFRVAYNGLKRLGFPFDHPGTYYSEGGGDMDISLFGGRFLIHAKSAKYPGTLVGEGLKGVIMAEAAKLKEIVWTKSIRPTLADSARDDTPSWALLTSTPEGKNWFYRGYMEGQDPAVDDTWSLRAPSWDNPVVFPGGRYDPEIISLERGMSTEKFKQEIGAEFTEFVGRVFKDFSEETHVGDFRYNPRWPVYIAQDAGFRNPSVALFLQVDIWDNVTVIAEYYERERTAREFGLEVLERDKLRPLANAARLMYPDPADPGTAAELEEQWKVKAMPDTGGELQGRLDLIRRWLKPQPFELEDGHPDKIPKLLIDRSCVNTIREMNDYRYPDSKEEQGRDPSEKPMKKDDHTPEALTRFFAGHYGNTELPETVVRQSRATFRSAR